MTSDVYNAKEKRVKEIIEALQASVYSSVRQCALKLKISRQTLNRIDEMRKLQNSFAKASTNIYSLLKNAQLKIILYA